MGVGERAKSVPENYVQFATITCNAPEMVGCRDDGSRSTRTKEIMDIVIEYKFPWE